MKQNYIKPTIDVVNIKVQNVLAASQPDLLFDPTGQTTTMDSRQGSLFFDDDFDEYYEEDYE